MPILLSTPMLNEPRAKIIDFSCHLYCRSMTVLMQFGDVVSGVWVPSPLVTQAFTINIDEPDYGELVDNDIVSGDNNKVYNAVQRVLYEYLLEKGIVVGVIE